MLMKTQMRLICFVTLLALFCAPRRVTAYYDPGAQRWINRGSSGEDGGPNYYKSVLNSPLQCVDALGSAEATATGTLGLVQPVPNLIPPDPGPTGPIGTPGHVPLIVGNGPVAMPVPNPVKYKRCGEDIKGYTQNSSTENETCPCSGTVIACIKFERCESVVTRVGTGPMPGTYYWVPHRKCPACPEGRYGKTY
jgi:hypothetical protein